ncbi:MAG TPA: DUF1071 domain-containing protein [Nitrososphaeraceae archaeon]
MSTEDTSEFEKLIALNVNDKTEKKGKFTYLSWAWAWAEFVKIYPEATYEVVKNENGLPYFSDDTGGMVYTKVKAGVLTHEMWLPIMDAYNKAKKQFDMMDVNKTVMRCLVKNLAMFGLGLYIYAGEDLPEGEESQQQKAPVPSKSTDDDKNQLWNAFKNRCGDIDPMSILERDGINMEDKQKVYATVRQYMALNDEMFQGVLDNF